MSADDKKAKKPAGKDGPKKPTYRIPADGPWANAWKIALMLGGLGLAASLFGAMSDPHRFAFSWLFAFMTFLAVGLGGLFFVLGQHLTGAGWGVTLRRTSEFMLSGLPVFLFLFIPIAMNIDELYPWAHLEGATHEEGEEHETGDEVEEAMDPEEHGALMDLSGVAHAQEAPRPNDLHPNAEGGATEFYAEHEGEHTPEHAVHHEAIEAKLQFLNRGFFLIRAGIYFLAWILLTYLFFSWSTRQDKERGLALTKKMQSIAPASTFVFGLTLTFAAVDWMMSAEPSWYSTIFGVQYFAVSAVIGHAVMILLTMGLRRGGLIGDAVSLEHLHEMGKLLFGFIVFWAYISFSQFMLIWYAGIPEEATYYHLRWWGGGGFLNLSVILVIAGFAIPFFLLLSRNAKRRLPILTFAAAWVAVMHIVQVYWLVMPYAEQAGVVSTSLRVHWMDISSLFAVGGFYLAAVLWQMTRYPLVPVGDPRLERALHHSVA